MFSPLKFSKQGQAGCCTLSQPDLPQISTTTPMAVSGTPSPTLQRRSLRLRGGEESQQEPPPESKTKGRARWKHGALPQGRDSPFRLRSRSGRGSRPDVTPAPEPEVRPVDFRVSSLVRAHRGARAGAEGASAPTRDFLRQGSGGVFAKTSF